MTSEVTLSPLTLLYNNDTCSSHFVVLAPPTDHALFVPLSLCTTFYSGMPFPSFSTWKIGINLSKTQLICCFLYEAFLAQFTKAELTPFLMFPYHLFHKYLLEAGYAEVGTRKID